MSENMAVAADSSDEPVTCAICWDPVHATGRGICILACGHRFHLACAGSAFNAKQRMECPTCRKTEEGDWLFAGGGSRSPSFEDSQRFLPQSFQHNVLGFVSMLHHFPAPLFLRDFDSSTIDHDPASSRPGVGHFNGWHSSHSYHGIADHGRYHYRTFPSHSFDMLTTSHQYNIDRHNPNHMASETCPFSIQPFISQMPSQHHGIANMSLHPVSGSSVGESSRVHRPHPNAVHPSSYSRAYDSANSQFPGDWKYPSTSCLTREQAQAHVALYNGWERDGFSRLPSSYLNVYPHIPMRSFPNQASASAVFIDRRHQGNGQSSRYP